jgi:hypothetical protein
MNGHMKFEILKLNVFFYSLFCECNVFKLLGRCVGHVSVIRISKQYSAFTHVKVDLGYFMSTETFFPLPQDKEGE